MCDRYKLASVKVLKFGNFLLEKYARDYETRIKKLSRGFSGHLKKQRKKLIMTQSNKDFEDESKSRRITIDSVSSNFEENIRFDHTLNNLIEKKKEWQKKLKTDY